MGKRLKTRLARFLIACEGAVLIETLLAVPVATVFAAGVLEFGNVFWQRQQMQVGVRDAARYWSRCRPDFGACSIDIARNIAFYGNPAGTGNLRVPGWSDAADLAITPATPPGAPVATDLVRVTGTLDYLGSPLFRLVTSGGISVTYVHEQRYIGW
ncbi:pilus assembly protein [Aliigemmobacter aestuarii]|uniref:Pilus assembly protein n=1 Tax=Aliigemmobacter aestuarii TaxID=1445661 RepID=A0A4S3MMD1_9RHOB|nr:TadE/TadG family type IV pilus assembly protein [Gemmobacter aestuarii]THD82451.1 pilus assembly protein [Gemmobacter aestuarii]